MRLVRVVWVLATLRMSVTMNGLFVRLVLISESAIRMASLTLLRWCICILRRVALLTKMGGVGTLRNAMMLARRRLITRLDDRFIRWLKVLPILRSWLQPPLA